MKTLEELKKLRDDSKGKVNMRETKDGKRIVVGMATCGIAAGARPVLNAFLEAVADKKLDNIKVTQVGCIGECTLEPIAEVYEQDGTRTTYCMLDEKKAKEIVEKHIIEGKIVQEYVIGNYK